MKEIQRVLSARVSFVPAYLFLYYPALFCPCRRAAEISGGHIKA